MKNYEFLAVSSKDMGHRDKIRHLLFSDVGNYCYSAGWDKIIIKWDFTQINDGVVKPERKFSGHQSAVSAIILVDRHQLLISGDKEGFLFVWNTHTGELILKAKTSHPKITALRLSEVFKSDDNFRFFSGGSDAKIILWEFSIASRELGKVGVLSGPSQPIHQIKEDIIHKKIICSGDERFIYIWENCNPQNSLRCIEFPEKIIFSFDLEISEEKGIILCGGQKKALYLISYERDNAPLLLDRIKTGAPISFIRFNPHLHRWLVCDFTGKFCLYSMENNKLNEIGFFSLAGLKDMLFVGLSDDWKYLAAVSSSDPTHQIRFFRLLD